MDGEHKCAPMTRGNPSIRRGPAGSCAARVHAVVATAAHTHSHARILFSTAARTDARSRTLAALHVVVTNQDLG